MLLVPCVCTHFSLYVSVVLFGLLGLASVMFCSMYGLVVCVFLALYLFALVFCFDVWWDVFAFLLIAVSSCLVMSRFLFCDVLFVGGV